VADTRLKDLAEDLGKFLVDIKPKPVEPPSVTEQRDVRQVSRAILEYVLHRSPEHTLAEDIGLAISVGASTAAGELDLKAEDILKGIEEFMGEALATARDALKSVK
jgi:hypothetical protein